MNNTLIVYASRHGTTSEYAKSLLQFLEGNVDLWSLDERKNSLPDISAYNTVIIGGSIHYGKNNKLIIDFTKKNIEILKPKRIGLFVTSYYDGDKALSQLRNAYPQKLFDTAVVADYFDGELLYPKMNFWEKMVAKVVLKADEIEPLISKKKVQDFADKLNH